MDMNGCFSWMIGFAGRYPVSWCENCRPARKETMKITKKNLAAQRQVGMDSYILCRNTQKQNKASFAMCLVGILLFCRFGVLQRVSFQWTNIMYMIQPTRGIEFNDNYGYGSRTRCKGTPEMAGILDPHKSGMPSSSYSWSTSKLRVWYISLGCVIFVRL